MGKALTGAAELAGAIGMGALAFFQPELVALPGYAELMGSLALSGLASEAGAIADALTQNRGQNLTMRQAAGFRQIVYGTQRIGGTVIWRSTTGSKKNQLNYVIVLATHQLSAITALYLDGRQVFWNPGSVGYTTYGASYFGGTAAGGSHVGPDGNSYDFGGKVYCEARFGNQASTDVIGGLTANDPSWYAGAGGTPAACGCAYVYLKLERDTTLFPTEPEIKFAVQGKPILDPRSGTTAYSHNPALIVNDILGDAVYGIGETSVNQAQLIAAANICEEQVPLAAGGTEDRYAAHWHYDTSTAPGDAVTTFLATMGGRISRPGGEWWIFPAAYIAPSASFGANDLTGKPQWKSTRKYRELFNRVNGTYTAANYPYNAAGNLYDSNGWYNGQIQNNFPFAFQPTNYPQYACDALHGYASDEYLNQDCGKKLPKELGFPAVLSIAQAQRLAKIALLRNRQQGTGTLPMSLRAYSLQPCDTFSMTFAQNGWANKVLEVTGTQLGLQSGGSGFAPRLTWTVNVAETAASVYEWAACEELSPYDVPLMVQTPRVPAAPANLALVSSAGTALVQPDGNTIPRIKVTWDTPEDALVTQIRLQYRVDGSAAWTDAGAVDVSLNAGYISPIVSGQTYDVQICSVRANGAMSPWVAGTVAAGLVLSVSANLSGIGSGSLAAIGNPDGTAKILCKQFTAQIGTLTPVYFAGGTVTLTKDGSNANLAQQKRYYVYVVDATAGGGNLTPIATLTPSDYLGKLGYWLIDSIVTPYANSSGTPASRFIPSTSQDSGTYTTSSPDAAFDGDVDTCATLCGTATATYAAGEVGPTETSSSYGSCSWSGFPNFTTTSTMTLTVVADTQFSNSAHATAGGVSVTATIGGTTVTLDSGPPAASKTTYTTTVPTGTNLSSITVTAVAVPGETPESSSNGSEQSTAATDIYEISVS